MANVNARRAGLEHFVKQMSTNAMMNELVMAEANAPIKREDSSVIALMAIWVMNVSKKPSVTPQQ